MHERVAVVDAEVEVRERISSALARDGFAVTTLPPDEETLGRIAKDGPFDVIVSDLSTEPGGGLELLDQIRRRWPGSEVIVLGAEAELATAMQALRLGASDYIRKPFSDPEIGLAVKRVLSSRTLTRENEGLRAAIRAHEAVRTLGSCVESADIFPLALDILSRVLGRERAVARLLDGHMHTIEGIYLRGMTDDIGRELRRDIELGKLFDPVELERSSPHGSEGLRNALQARGLQDVDLLALPLRSEGRLIGGIWLFADGRDFAPYEVRCAEIVVEQAELALKNSERFAQATEKAFVDDVTDLYNARYLLAAVDREIERADRGDLEVSVLFLDLDRFKLVNDRYGHLVGSSVLRELGGVLRESIRAIDTVGRYGGDEFTMILVDTGLQGATRVAERIRRTVGDRAFAGSRGLQLELTLSVGVATFPIHGRTRDKLIDMADKAMYLAKALGRDQVCTADELTAPQSRRRL